MPSDRQKHFKRGDVVVVRSTDEILATLDADGTLDGMPFMPEMVESCGQRRRVARRVEKTCVEGDPKIERMFWERDVVALENERCSGDAHAGCKRNCTIFWKEEWLRPAEADETEAPVKATDRERLLGQLKTRRDDEHYFCQSTELARSTQAFPWKVRAWFPYIAALEITSGDRSLSEVVRQAVTWAGRQRRKRAVDPVRGPLKRTPSESLGLQPGERVRVKSEEDIIATLDDHGRNRGLSFGHAMSTFCGREFVVAERFDRMILEGNGKLRKVTNTVTLEGSDCLCWYRLGSCPRGDHTYWREIWLERVEEPGSPEA